MKLKLEQILFAGLAVTMLFTACKKTETLSSVAGSKNAVTFSASISSAGTGTTAAVSKIKTLAVTPSQTVPRAVNNTWEANDAIGVYMKQGNGLSQIVSGNKKYTTTGNGSFTAASTADAITFPVNGAPVDFISYYPYKSSLTNNIYPVDVSNQSSQGAIDLMYSNNAVNLDKTTPKASLVFTHQLSKLVFVVKNGGGVPNLTGLSASIDGLNTGGDFDLATGTLKVNGKTAAIAAKITPEATDVLVEAIVPPAASITGATVTFTLPSGKFTWTVPANAVYEKGKKYTYQIELRNTDAIPIPVTLSATITDWVDVPSGSYVVEPFKPTNAQLIAYKNSPHEIYAGFYRVYGPCYGGRLDASDFSKVPDSLDVLILFCFVPSDPNAPSADNIKKWIDVLHSKGTKVIMTGGLDLVPGATHDATGYAKTAQNIMDNLINKYGLDGYDIDIESYPQDQDLTDKVGVYTALSKFLGPKSGTKKLLTFDTNQDASNSVFQQVYSMVDYVWFQAYNGSADPANSKWSSNGYSKYIKSSQYIIGFSFYEERGAPGNDWGNVNYPIKGIGSGTAYDYAKWEPTDAKKGGVFGYAIDRDQPLISNSDDTMYFPNYIVSKRLIQIMNPSSK